MDFDSALDGLRDGTREERRATARRLFKASRSPRWDDDLESADLDRLVPFLADDDPLVRGHVTAVLGDLAFDLVDYDEPVPHLDVLFGQLTDEDASVRQTVLGVLHNRPDQFRLGGLDAYDDRNRIRKLAALGFVRCLDDDTALVRERAAEHVTGPLVAEHPELDATVLPILFDRLDDERVVVRRTAIEAIGSLVADAPDAVSSYADELVARLDAPCEEVRVGAARALMGMGDEDPKILDAVVDTLVETIESADRDRQTETMEALGTLVTRAPSVADRVVDPLLDRFADPLFRVRGTAAAQLVTIAELDPSLVPDAIVTLAETGTEKPLDQKGIFPLAITAETHPEFAGDRLAELCRAIADPDFDPRATVGLICEEVTKRDRSAIHPAVDVLHDLLSHDDAEVRGRAVLALEDLSDLALREMLDAVPDIARTLPTVGQYPRRSGSKILVSTARADPGRLSPVVGELEELARSVYTDVRHNAAVALVLLARSDAADGSALGDTFASSLESENGLEDLPPEDDRWPLAPVLENVDGVLSADDVTAEVERLPMNPFRVDDLTRYLTEVAHGDAGLFDAAVVRLESIATEDGDRGEQARDVLEDLSDEFPSRIRVGEP